MTALCSWGCNGWQCIIMSVPAQETPTYVLYSSYTQRGTWTTVDASSGSEATLSRHALFELKYEVEYCVITAAVHLAFERVLHCQASKATQARRLVLVLSFRSGAALSILPSVNGGGQYLACRWGVHMLDWFSCCVHGETAQLLPITRHKRVSLANANTEGSTANTYSSSQETHAQRVFCCILEVSIWEKSCCIKMEVWISGWFTYSTTASKSFSSKKNVYSTISAKFKSLLPEELRSPYPRFHRKSPDTRWHKAVFPSL